MVRDLYDVCLDPLFPAPRPELKPPRAKPNKFHLVYTPGGVSRLD
jgi:hypothetical protein